MATLTLPTSTIGSIPIQVIRRTVKQKPTFLLGLIGCFDCDSQSLEAAILDTWQAFIDSLVASIESEWKIKPQMVSANEDPQGAQVTYSGRTRYNLIDQVSSWRQRGFCVVDFGCGGHETLRKLGRHCDGVAMLVEGNMARAKCLLKDVKREAIPWIGYWAVRAG